MLNKMLDIQSSNVKHENRSHNKLCSYASRKTMI